jgi:TonB family protein
MFFFSVSAHAQQKSEHIDAAFVEGVEISPEWSTGTTQLDTKDPQGEFQKYVYKPMVNTLYREWSRHMPREAHPPKCAEATSRVQFQLLPDGKIANETLLSSTGNKKLDRHAIRAVKKARFAPFPEDMGLREVTFRVRFEVNPAVGANQILSDCNQVA